MPEDEQHEGDSGRESYPIDPAVVESDASARRESGGDSTEGSDADPTAGQDEDSTSGAPAATRTDLDPADLPVEVKREFLVQVLLLNLGLLAVALGAMLLYFRWWLDLGGGLIVIGLVAILLAYRRYVDRPSVE